MDWTMSLSKGREAKVSGDIGVRFDKLNERGDEKVPELAVP